MRAILMYSSLIIFIGNCALHTARHSDKLVEKYFNRFKQLDCVEIYDISKYQKICQKGNGTRIYVSPTTEQVIKIK